MPQAVGRSIDDFVEAVAEAIGIVLVVSLISLGFRTGMVVAISIPLVLAATSLCMYLFHIGLHKISLGTLILALGLLVDDAIISVETMAVKLEQGYDRLRAAAFAYTSTAFPMLTGTLVTVAGFLPIALAKSTTGEYTRSIFEVSAIALLLSWLAAVPLIDLRLPEGASFAAALREAQRFEAVLAKRPQIDHFVDFVGAGAPRFYLPLDQQLAAPNFAQFVVTAKGVKQREQLATDLADVLRKDFASVRTRITRLENGPPIGFPVQFRVTGPEIGTVRRLSEQVAGIIRSNPDTVGVQFDWDEPAERSGHFEIDQTKAHQLNVSSQDIENYLEMSMTGYTLSQLRKRDK